LFRYPESASRSFLCYSLLYGLTLFRMYIYSLSLHDALPISLADITSATQAVQAILHETELHKRLTAQWGIAEDELLAAPEKRTTVAYTRYVLDAGMSGDLLDLHVALSPCTIG